MDTEAAMHSERELLSFIVKLSFFSKAVFQSRTFIRSLTNASKRARLSHEMKLDIRWWFAWYVNIKDNFADILSRNRIDSFLKGHLNESLGRCEPIKLDPRSCGSLFK